MNQLIFLGKKCQAQKKYNHKKTKLRGKSIRRVHNHMAKSNNKTHQQRMDKNCHIPDLVQAFSNVENGGLNLILQRQTSNFDDSLIKFHYIYNDALTKQTQYIKQSKYGYISHHRISFERPYDNFRLSLIIFIIQILPDFLPDENYNFN